MSNPPPTYSEPVCFRVSPRRVLRPGMTFRTIRGSGPTADGKPIGQFEMFRCLRLYRIGPGGRRLYCAAVNDSTGGLHDLYLSGPAFTSQLGIRQQPYRIKLVPQPARF